MQDDANYYYIICYTTVVYSLFWGEFYLKIWKVVSKDWVAVNISGPNVQKISSGKQEACRDV